MPCEVGELVSGIVESKSEFAKRIGVTAGRVSQFLKEGKITAAGIEGEGRRAKIRVDVALKNLERNLDVSQRLGNGLNTNLKFRADPSDEADPDLPDQPKTVADLIADEKLQQMRVSNRRLAEEELVRRGIYTKTSEVKSGYVALAGAMLRTFEGALPEIATSLAAEFKLPQRDVLHILKGEMRKIRESAAKTAKQKVSGLDQFRFDTESQSVEFSEEGQA